MSETHNLQEYEQIATRLRLHVVNMVAPSGQGYVQQGLGAADIFTALYFGEANMDPAIVTAENHNVIGGLGSAVAEVLTDAGIGLPFKRVGVQDHFCEGGTTPYLLKKFGLDSTSIADACRDVMKRKK